MPSNFKKYRRQNSNQTQEQAQSSNANTDSAQDVKRSDWTADDFLLATIGSESISFGSGGSESSDGSEGSGGSGGSSGSGGSDGSGSGGSNGSSTSGSDHSHSGPSESGSGSSGSGSSMSDSSGSGGSDSSGSGSDGSGSDSGSGSISCSSSGMCREKTEPEPCESSCGCNMSNSGAYGVSAPVNLANGVTRISMSYLQTGMGSFNIGFHNQYFVNDERLERVDVDFGLGNNWSSQQFPYLLEDEQEIYINFQPESFGPFRFQPLGNNSFAPLWGTRASLTVDNEGDFRLTLDDGTVHVFDGSSGFILQSIDTSDVVTDYTVDGNGRTQQVMCEFLSGGMNIVEVRDFEYLFSGSDGGRVQRVTLRRSVDNGPMEDIRRVELEYYDANQNGLGSTGDLKYIRQQELDDAQDWITEKTEYFRYHTESNSPIGIKHGLKFKLNPEEYQNVILAEGDPELLDDSEIAPFAGVYFEYDSDRRVTKVRQDGGELTNDMAYTINTHRGEDPDMYNDWFRKATYTTEDGIIKTVYSNEVGGDVLIDDQEISGSGRWIHHFKYNVNGRRIETRRPSAINLTGTPYNDSSNDLNVQIKSNSGLIELTTYYAMTNPATGAVDDRVEHTQVKEGSGGSPIYLTTTAYHTRTVIGDEERTIYPVSQRTVYRTDTGDGTPVATEFLYDWHGNTLQASQMTTKLPDIEASQNGIGHPQQDETIVEYDHLGRMTSQTDAIGTVTLYSYDPATGARTQMIQDAGSGGLALTTDYAVDHRGRTIEMLGPEHDFQGSQIRTATWTIYVGEYETWTGQGINTFGGGVLVNPVSISKRSVDGLTVDSATATRGTGVESHGKLTAADSFPQNSWVRWSQQRYGNDGRLMESRTYHDIPSFGPGNLGMHYSQTTYGYDSVGRQNKVVSATGTITRTVFDRRGQVISTWIGTDDTGATDSDPTGNGAVGNNMKMVSYSEYDGNANGLNGNLTKTVQIVTASSADDRITTFEYDWRDRQYKSTSTDGTFNFIQEATLDNLGRAIVSQTLRDGSPSKLIAKSETLFDDRGRTYRSITWGVDDSGNTTNPLVSDMWYDAAGRVLKSASPGSGLFVKTLYDAIGRVLKSYQAYYHGTGSDDPTSVAGNVVMSQSETLYDDAGRVLITTPRERYHDASTSAQGALDLLVNLSLARVTYTANWYDKIGRSTDTANYGTNGGLLLTRPSLPPSSSDDILVYKTQYNYKGEVYRSVGPDGIITEMEFDDLGRTTKTTRNFNGSETEVTRQVYNGVGLMIELIAENSSTGDQTTSYEYGVTLANSGTANNDALRKVIHPDDGEVIYSYNRAGEQTGMTDQNGTIHAYTYDKAGRMTKDVVVSVGSGIDAGVQLIERSYDNRSRLSKVSSYSSPLGGSGNIANEIQYIYNGFNQIVQEFQQHGSAVNMSTSPVVEYGYADGSNNTIRMTFLKYPDGRQIDYDYGTSGSQNDRLSRVENLDDSAGSLTTYQYAGIGQVISAEYTEPDLTYSIPGGMTGGYTGLDRFGRLTALQWKKGTAKPVAFEYGYDRRGNRLYEKDTSTSIHGSGAVHVDALLEYDGLDRLVDFQRGTLNSTNDAITSPNLTQAWALDQTGNWNEFNQSVTNAGSQTRTHNEVNEITGITVTSGSAWDDPAHDANGNMTEIPKPTDLASTYTAKWDAWNRLVELKDGTTLVARYEYDGSNRRVVIKDYNSSGVLTDTNHLYLSTSAQVLEEHVDTSTLARQQYVWGLRFVDDLILRDRDVARNGDLEEHLYAMHDLRFSVVALANPSGTVQERYMFDAYGRRTVMDNRFILRSNTSYAWEFAYTGRRRDIETALYFFRARYYSAELGRFVGRDPLGFVDGMSLYRAYFTPGDVDPQGTDLLDCMVACVDDNDPFDLAVEAAIAQLTVGFWPKEGFLEVAKLMEKAKVPGAAQVVKDIRFDLNVTRQGLTTMPQGLKTLMRQNGKKAFDAIGRTSGAIARVAGPVLTGYGLAMAAVEIHCLGVCTACWWYDVKYDSEFNIKESLKSYFE